MNKNTISKDNHQTVSRKQNLELQTQGQPRFFYANRIVSDIYRDNHEILREHYSEIYTHKQQRFFTRSES